MKRLSLIFILSLSLGQIAFPTDLPKKQFSDIYNLELDTSNSHIQSSNCYEILADDYSDFIYLLVSGLPEKYEAWQQRHKIRLDRIANTANSLAERKYCISEINLHWALIYWRFGDYLKSGIHLRRAYKNLLSLKEDKPEMIEINKSLGLLHILLSAIPNEYDWLLKLFGFENNLARGMNELELAAETENPFRFESELLKTYVQIFVLDKKSEGFSRIQKLEKTYNFKIVPFVKMVYCHKSRKNEAGLKEIYNEKWIYAPAFLKPMLSLLRGEFELKKLNYKEAEFYLKDFLFIYQGLGFRENARLKLFYCYYLEDKKDKAEKVLNQSEGQENELNVSDKYAEEFFKKQKKPDEILLKARLLFDGGYYKESRKQLTLYSYKSLYVEEYQIEYYYRKGRVEQQLGNYPIAIEAFKKCIEIQDKDHYYFAPNACLQLGYIYRDSGDIKNAEKYFHKSLEYKNYAYRRSIEHQAKTALNGLR